MFRTAVLAALLLATPVVAQERLYPEPPPASHFEGIGALQQRLEQEEAATFAGLWVMPNQRDVTVAFTRDAATTLRKYTTDPKYKPLDRPGPSARELQQTQEHLFKALERLGARPVMAGVNIMEGRVEIEVVGDMTATRAAIADGELKVPSWVRISEPKPLAYPDPPPPPPGFANPVKAFPRVNFRSGGIELAVLRFGETVLEDGCLKLKGDRRNVTIAWPNEARLDLSKGDVRVFHRMTGESIRIGERIILGGSSHELKDDRDVIDTNAACPGPYVHLTGFRPAAPFEAEMRERSIKDRALREGISEAQARQLIETEEAREARLRGVAERLKAERPDLFGEAQFFEGKTKLLLAGDLPAGFVPAELAPYVEVQRVPYPAAELDRVRDRVLYLVEALGLEGVSAGSEVEFGRVTLNVGGNILKVAEAARDGRLVIPDDVQIMTDGAGPAGHFSEWNMEAAWKALEAAPDFAAIRQIVAATDIPFYGEAPRRPSANGATEIARYLVMLGFTADEIRRLRAQGIDPVIDWEAQNGRATLENRAALAENVVIGEVVAVDPRALLGDGARTTVTFRVAETLKGAATPDDTVKVRLESGFNADGTFAQTNGDPMLLPGLPRALTSGDRYVLFLSSGQYANLARHAGGKPVPGMTMLRQEMTYILPDGRLARTYSEPAPASTLDELKARIAPVRAKFEAANVH